jgi:hypothetical protein
MNDAQIMSISITALAIFAGPLYNNVRIGDMSGRFSDMSARFADVNRRTDDLGAVLRAEMKAMQTELHFQFERTNDKMDSILKLVADIDERVTAREARKP